MDVDSGSGATKIHICKNVKTDISSTRVFILLSFLILYLIPFIKK